MKYLYLVALLPVLAMADSTLKIDGQVGLTIDGGVYSSATGNCIDISNSSNITVTNARFNGCYLVGVNIGTSSGVTVKNSVFYNTGGGVYAVSSSGISVIGNKFKNVTRRPNNSRGQFVQFNMVTGAGNKVDSNIGLNEPGLSAPEDLVNLHASSGTLESPISVSGNCFKGGGPSKSGGGIMAGDFGGKHQTVANNIMVDVGQYGIAAASGENIQIVGNKIYGKQQPFTNIGMYVWKQSNTPCANINVTGNAIDFTKSTGIKNPFWNAGNCANVVVTKNDLNSSQATLSCPEIP